MVGRGVGPQHLSRVAAGTLPGGTPHTVIRHMVFPLGRVLAYLKKNNRGLSDLRPLCGSVDGWGGGIVL